MPRLKKILQSNVLYYFLFFFIVIFVIINYKFDKDSIYNLDTNYIIGKVFDFSVKEGKTSILLSGEEKVIVNSYNNNLNVNFGDVIKVEGKMVIPRANTISHNFNYRKYLKNKGINYTMTAKKVVIVKRNTNILCILKNNIVKRIDDIDSTGYLRAFIIGDKGDLELYSSYQDLGVAHLFAISGMHIGFFSIFFMKIFKRFKHKILLLDIWLFIYAFIVSFPPSVLRTIFFLVIKQLNDKMKFDISNVRILFLTIFILVLGNYRIVTEMSFMYSISCVFGLFYVDNKHSNNTFINLLFSSFIVSLFSLPINLLFFYRYNVLSIFLNVIYIPFVSLIIYPFSLFVFFFPFLMGLFQFLIFLLEKITFFFSSFDAFTVYMSFSWFISIIYYALLLLFINRGFKYTMVLLIFIILIKYAYLFDFSYSLYFFDVGQGDSVLLVSPQHKDVIMIDTGGAVLNTGFHISNNIIEFFHAENISSVSTLVITHGDYDHMGEAINLVNNFKVEKVIFNCGTYNDLEKELIKVLDKKNIKYYSCIKELDIDKNKLYFLQTKEYDNENDNSNVIITELDGYKFMFMGDASITTEKEILDKYNLQDIDVLKVGHHGSKTSSSKEFIDDINPKYSVISVGKNNRYGHPNKEVLDNLNDSKVYRTDQDGSIMFKIKDNKLKIETCSP